jgi:tRNA pseudouridine38-40 synthase
MLHLKLTIAYDGTGLVGWQRQPMGTSVQALLEDALAPLDGAPVRITGAGRTDAGVHALGQVASVVLQRTTSPDVVVRAMNNRLPPGVRVLSAAEVPAPFHARFDAVSKTYRYRIWNVPILDPFERRYVWHIPGPSLDVEAMDDAARRLEGRHDFAAFEATGSDRESTVRTLFSSRVTRATGAGGALLTCEVRGDGFLRHMMRSMVGTLVEIGRGRHPPSWIDDLLQSRDRHRSGLSEQAAGLFLVRVDYP